MREITDMHLSMFVTYIGPGARKGEVHRILAFGPREVITWGENSDNTWLGPLADFRAQFRTA
jgi:hypothetical protein